MTAEQKVSALEAYNLPDLDRTGWVKKDLYDKVPQLTQLDDEVSRLSVARVSLLLN